MTIRHNQLVLYRLHTWDAPRVDGRCHHHVVTIDITFQSDTTLIRFHIELPAATVHLPTVKPGCGPRKRVVSECLG